MPDLRFTLEGAKAVEFAATPLLGFSLRVTNALPDELVHTVVLRCQVQLEVTRRRYGAEEAARLHDLFGEPERWSSTLRGMLWTTTSVIVPSFSAETTVEVPMPCTFDFNVAATKYFYGLDSGEIPLSFLFSGSVFYADTAGTLQVAPVPWDREARFRLPLSTWRGLMDHYYPNIAWLALRRDVFDRLYQYKIQKGIPTWEQAVEEVMQP